MRIEPPGARASTFKPTVRAVEPNRELRWLGRLLVPGIFDGEHSLLIEPREGGRSHFVQSERFSGFLVGFVKGTLATGRSARRSAGANPRPALDNP